MEKQPKFKVGDWVYVVWEGSIVKAKIFSRNYIWGRKTSHSYEEEHFTYTLHSALPLVPIKNDALLYCREEQVFPSLKKAVREVERIEAANAAFESFDSQKTILSTPLSYEARARGHSKLSGFALSEKTLVAISEAKKESERGRTIREELFKGVSKKGIKLMSKEAIASSVVPGTDLLNLDREMALCLGMAKSAEKKKRNEQK